MECLTIIPARGGSKGIPHKNIRPIAGKPMLVYSIEHARQAPDVTRIVVSTDDEEIAAVARQAGADVVWRPATISGDTATSESALLHTLDHLRDSEGYEPDLVVFLQATSPVRQPDDIQRAIETLRDEEADSLLSVAPVHGFIWRKQGADLSSFSYDYRNRQRRQDAPEDLLENGSIYIFKPWVLRQLQNRLGGKIAIYRMRTLDSFQVDEPGDLELIEHLLSFRPAQAGHAALAGVRLLVLDFDGVMTDNRVLVDQDGREAVLCHRGDGWGIARLRDAGMQVVVLSTETNPVVAARCRKLKIDCLQGYESKLEALQLLAQERGASAEQVAFVGNDVNDLTCMQWVGFPIAVSDAVPQIRAVARFVTHNMGGWGAVREVCEWLLAEQQRSA